ncbi:MAG: sulfatase-like hydrolase/transferase, partial [Verrucomicrobiales bacterium]|nr:sulfatase-like hydrolase/transferase [Verrucomicrobiales bacterium]
FLPNDQGFDYYYGLPYSNDMGTVEDGAKSNPGEPIRPRPAQAKAQPRDEAGLRGTDQPPLPLLENHTVIERVKQGGQTSIARRYTEKAEAFIRQHRDGPFFLYLPHTAVHFPLYPGMKWRGTSKNGLTGDWTQEVDWSVGRVLDTVRELGLEKNTFILFTSDNGGTKVGFNTPLRGHKGSTWEGGMRVCTIAWWPGKIPAGTETRAITGMLDMLPTIAEIAGVQPPQDRKLDGVSVLSALTGDAQPRDTMHYFRGPNLEAVRQGPWKLHLKSGELYNLDSDIGEASNVAAQHADVVARLRSLAKAMNDELGDGEFGPGCRPLGRVDDPQPLISLDGKIRPGFEPQ